MKEIVIVDDYDVEVSVHSAAFLQRGKIAVAVYDERNGAIAYLTPDKTINLVEALCQALKDS